MPSTTDLRELLSSDAEQAPSSPFPVEAVIGRAHRVRLLRRAATVTGSCLAAGAAVVTITLAQGPELAQEPGGETIAPPDQSPAVPISGGWVLDLPGVDLPVGAPLTTTFASGSELVMGTIRVDLGAVIEGIIDVPGGTVVVTTGPESFEEAPNQLQLVRADGEVVVIDTGVVWSVRAQVDPAGGGSTRLAWLWGAGRGTVEMELRSVSLDGAQTMSSIAGSFHAVLGFSGEAVLVSTTTTETATPDLGRWMPGSDVVEPFASTPDLGVVLALAENQDPDRALMSTLGTRQCTYAAPLTDLGESLWQQCEGGPLVPAPDGATAANELGVVDLATGAFLVRFDLGSASQFDADQSGAPDGDGTNLRVAGWSGDDVLIKWATTAGVATTPAPGGAWTFTPAYVGVRCSATTGACERIPHPIDAIAGASS